MNIITRAAAMISKIICRLRNVGLDQRNRSMLMAMDDSVYRDIGLSRFDGMTRLPD